MLRKVDPYWVRMAEATVKRFKKAELVGYLARALAEEAEAKKSAQESAEKLAEANTALAEFKSIKKAIEAVREHHRGGDLEAVLSNILDKSTEIIEAVNDRTFEEHTIEGLLEERERMLRALGMTEDQWLVKGWRY